MSTVDRRAERGQSVAFIVRTPWVSTPVNGASVTPPAGGWRRHGERRDQKAASTHNLRTAESMLTRHRAFFTGGIHQPIEALGCIRTHRQQADVIHYDQPRARKSRGAAIDSCEGRLAAQDCEVSGQGKRQPGNPGEQPKDAQAANQADQQRVTGV